MIRIEDFPQPRDGTVWRRARSISALRSSAIHPQRDRLYYGRGPDQVAGYIWCEPDGGTGVVCLWEAELERVEDG